MFVRDAQQVDAQVMTMAGAQGVTMRLMVGRSDGAPNFAMRLFEVAPGGCTPFHSHNYEHAVWIVSGRGCLMRASGDAAQAGDAEQGPAFGAGSAVFIAPNEHHQFRNLGSDPLRFVCMVPVSFDCGGACQPTPGS